jgi:hypothetical protein
MIVVAVAINVVQTAAMGVMVATGVMGVMDRLVQ